MLSAQEHDHIWGPVEHARITGNPHLKCQVLGCRDISLDLEGAMHWPQLGRSHWHIVTNVPGYLPESEVSIIAWDDPSARKAVEDEAKYQAEDYRGYSDIVPSYSDDGLFARVISDDKYDLGLVIEAIECSEGHEE